MAYSLVPLGTTGSSLIYLPAISSNYSQYLQIPANHAYQSKICFYC